MATPFMTVQSKSFSLDQAAKNVLTWLVKDSAGAPVDISSGYTAICNVRPGSNANSEADAVELGGHGAWSYGADGTLQLTLAQFNSKYLPSLSSVYNMLVSNDSFATSSLAGKGTITINPGVF